MKMMKMALGIDLSEAEKVEPCRGLYWRGRVNIWCNENIIQSKKSVQLLKRKSCSGCEYCDWILEFIKEDMGSQTGFDPLADIEDGKIYQIVFDSSRDFESGYDEIDGWYLEEVENIEE